MLFDLNSTDTDVLEAYGHGAAGKTVLITGPSSSGIGSQVATSIATTNPETIILAGRNETKIQPVAAEIRRSNPDVTVKIVLLDLLSNRSIRQAVQEIAKIISNIDILINNAGVMATRTFMYSEDGVESHFASNYLGHFLFTNLLIKETLIKSGDIIVNVGSLAYQMADINFEDVNFNDGTAYNGWKAYGQAKSAQILGTRGLANQLKGKNIPVLIVHPGVTLESQLLANSAIDQDYFGEAYTLAIERNDGKPLPPQNTVTLKQAAGVVLFTALNTELREMHAAFIVENKIYDLTRDYANNDADAVRLWKLSEELVGETFSF